MRLRTRYLAAALCVAGIGSAPFMPIEPAAYADHQEKDQAGRMDIIETAMGPGMTEVTTVVSAIKAADLVDTLKGPGPFTVFAPTNKAFEKLPKGTVEELLKPRTRRSSRAS